MSKYKLSNKYTKNIFIFNKSICNKYFSSIMPNDTLKSIITKELTSNSSKIYEYKLRKLEEALNKPIVDNGKVVISSHIYKELLNKGMLGNLNSFEFQNTQINLISTIYTRINSKNLLQALQKLNSDFLIVQFRPDLIFNNISKKAKQVVSGIIQEEIYLKDLIRNSIDVHPSSDTLKSVINTLNLKLDISKYDNLIASLSKLKTPEIRERVSFEALSVAGIYGDIKNLNIMLADIPLGIQIPKICNNYSLLEIKKIWEQSLKELPQNPDFEPQSALTTAQHLYPEIFLKDSDNYFSKCIKYLVNGNKINNLTGITGYGQSFSIPIYFENDNTSLTQILDTGKRYRALIYGLDSLEIVMDKLSYLFLLFFGLAKKIPIYYYKEIIEDYVDEDIRLSGNTKKEEMIDKCIFLFETLLEEKKSKGIILIKEGLKIQEKSFLEKVFEELEKE